jgi:competence protein ComEC
VSCDEAGCVTPLADGRLVALAMRIDALADDCSRAALVVTARPAPPDCAAMVVDRQRLSAQGALALTRRGDGFAVQAVKARGTDRPWSPATAGEGDFGASLAPQAPAPRNRDATPSEADMQAED